METLTQVLTDPIRRGAVVKDAALLVESEVGSKRGMRGMALKGGYKSVKRIKPGIIEEALEMLLPQFAPAVDPYYARGRESGNVESFFTSHADEIADALLGVTDRRAARATNRVMKKVYSSLRGQAKVHVVDAIPGLSRLVSKHVR